MPVELLMHIAWTCGRGRQQTRVEVRDQVLDGLVPQLLFVPMNPDGPRLHHPTTYVEASPSTRPARFGTTPVAGS